MFNKMFNKIFDGMYDDIFNISTSLEYRQYKGTTPYKLMCMVSGAYKITFDKKLLDYQTQDKEEAQKYFIYLCKNYKGVK